MNLRYNAFFLLVAFMSSKNLPSELVNLLSDGNFHSGEAIGELLGISRAAVWKRLRGLESFDLKIESVKGKGYRLDGPVSLFDEARIAQYQESSNKKIWVHQNLDSTNAEALRALIDNAVVSGDVIVAERQEAGRGRRGKSWASPFGKNLYCSVVQSFKHGAVVLDGLSLVVGISLAETIRELEIDAQLKWPNDVLCEGRKLAGILLEIHGDPTDACHVVIGVGVNVNMLDAQGAVDQPWASLAQLSKGRVDKTFLLLSFLEKLEHNLKLFSQSGFAYFLSQWQSFDAYENKEVVITLGDKKVFGKYAGVNDKGELRLEIDGVERTFNGGEVSLRKQ